MYNLSVSGVILRFYIMMACVIIPIFIGYPVLAFLSIPVFLSIMFGISFKRSKENKTVKQESRSQIRFSH